MLIQGDARFLPLADQSVQCVVTSPPYFGLRDYGSLKQIGLESTPVAYVTALLEVFAEVWRVLKSDGTLWLNLGDSYAAGGKGGGGSFMAERREAAWQKRSTLNGWRKQPEGCKEKDLLGIPWMVAFALRDAGWYLRSDIIWSKPNPMPESVTDRPTKAHEYLFLLSKSEKYFYDAAAIYEPVSDAMLAEMDQGYDGLGLKDYESAGVQNPSTVKSRIIENARRKAEYKAANIPGQSAHGYTKRLDGGTSCGYRSAHMEGTPRNDGDRWRTVDGGVAARGLGRNKRTVWEIPTQPYAGAHFATFPEALVEPCVLAGSRLQRPGARSVHRIRNSRRRRRTSEPALGRNRLSVSRARCGSDGATRLAIRGNRQVTSPGADRRRGRRPQ